MTLGELITALEAADPNQIVSHGFHNPHSYRGDYMDLAFEPAQNVTVASMLEAARTALGTTYQGWKGGDFTMDADTWCWLSEQGTASCDNISSLLFKLMLAQPADEAQQQDVETHPARDRWYIEILDGDCWDLTSRFHTERVAAVRDMDRRNGAAPQWDDGKPVRRRLVRETTTHTVESVVSQPAKEA